jgi:hypothetical protein
MVLLQLAFPVWNTVYRFDYTQATVQYFQMSKPVLEPTQPPVQWGPVLFPGG